MGITRREFLIGMTTTFGGALTVGLSGCGGNGGESPGALAQSTRLTVGTQQFEFGSTGSVFLLERENHDVVALNANGTQRFRIVGRPFTGAGDLNYPVALAQSDSGLIYVLSKGGSRVHVYQSNGQPSFVFGGFGNGPGQFSYPSDLVIDRAGNLFVTDSFNHRIDKFTADGGYVQSIGSFGLNGAGLNAPKGIDLDAFGLLHVTDSGNFRVSVFQTTGQYLYSYGSRGSGPGQFKSLIALAIAPTGIVYVADAVAGKILMFDNAGRYLAQISPQMADGTPALPVALAYSPSDTLMVKGLPGRSGS